MAMRKRGFGCIGGCGDFGGCVWAHIAMVGPARAWQQNRMRIGVRRPHRFATDDRSTIDARG